jgi:hypothetical protein
VIAKERQIPIRVQKLEALLRRLPNNHVKRKEIEEELARRYAGYRGEQSMDFYFSYLTKKKYNILHDLRLFDKQHYFQIDTVILTPCFFLIVEVKNFLGSLFFDSSFQQLIRTYNGKEEAFQNPLTQAKRHQSKLKQLMLDTNLPIVPIDYMVVISNPQTIINTTPDYKEAILKVTTSSNFLNKVEKLQQLYKDEKVNMKEIKKISKLLVTKHTPSNPDILKQFNIPKNDLVSGVYCQNCSSISMERQTAKWFCPNCSFSSKDAHLSSINDYSLLFDSTITNQKLRDFLIISSRTTASKLLTSMQLPFSGRGKGREYFLTTEQMRGLTHKN